MVKDQEFLKSKASYCLDLAKKMGATDATVTVGSLEDVGMHVDVNYDVLTISGYSLGAQLTVLMPEDDYKTAMGLEDSELSYNISLSKAF